MILFFIFLFICIFYNELVFLLQTEKESRKIKLDHPRWPNFVDRNGTRVLRWDSVDWYGSSGEKITLIDKCSNELYALQFQIPTYGNFSFVPAYHSLETKSSVQWRCSFVALSLLMNTVSKLDVQQLVNSFGDYGASIQRGIMVPLKW